MDATFTALANEQDARLKSGATSSMDYRVAEKWGERGEDPYWNPNNNEVEYAFQKEVYEYPENSNGSAPSNPRLEEELYSDEHRIHAGVYFDKYTKAKVSRKGGPETHTPIENKNAIPLIMGGYDLLACSQTGSGKTAAFLLPILSKISTKLERTAEAKPNQPGARRRKASPQALIILPTRELSIQIFDEARRTRVRPMVIYGGADVRAQKEKLALGCDLLIATPGRLADAMERGAVALDRVKYLVLDEADRSLDEGFENKIRDILLSSDLPRDEGLQTMMFSATFPNEIQCLARDFMKEDYCRLRIGRIGGTTTDIIQKVLYVEEDDKENTLIEILLSQPPSRTIIFVATKWKADYLDDILYNMNFPCISLHGDRSQRERELALEAFKIGRSPILVATAVAARGLDIKDILHVINYDLSDDIDDYVHRIGRTARAGNPGLATTFFNEGQNYRIAPQLTQLLSECQQMVPDFLAEYISDKGPREDDFYDSDTADDGGGHIPSNGVSASYESKPANNPASPVEPPPAPAPEQLEQPEQPEKPEQPEQPEQPSPWGFVETHREPQPTKEWNGEQEAAARGWN
ncbi:DEAD-box ATP-dependent RNA helicase [Entomortierella chlamydospora]|uniref:RNA helicase n=1 Tax=Entomortierella chlamydospora TaxID=101097 RepID=A0A9P6N0X6_9FUNG|nr:DEAD-box ATP-dependent RNA helicase [Entomortierella chlamydospora]